MLLAVSFLVLLLTIRKKHNKISSGLIIFHAGSLGFPLKQICQEFGRHYAEVRIVREAAGSRLCARKITDLNRPCDIIASSDYTVIDTLLIPGYADWNIKFASNEIVIAFSEDSHKAGDINKDNWYDILLEKDVAFGRSDPNADPCGYRAVFTITLAEKFYNKPGLAAKLLAKDKRHIRPKEVDLLALLEVGELDYIFTYRSVAEQHELKYIRLADEINLKRAEFADIYKSVSVSLTGKKPGTRITKTGVPIVYGVTMPKNAPNRKLALAFLAFLLDADKGGAILEKNGQTFLVPSPTDTFDKIPDSLKRFALPVGTEDRGQRTEDRGQKTEDRRQILTSDL
ncbi:MAG: tungstate ABC transporter substrate-binding protein WtpA [Planctomycetes bacterium]|nr:tungstate ABC transporter substrate-binding protein WtpA [Planctomycetota bacterium]